MDEARQPNMILSKILVVDDDPDARNLLDIALSTVAGFEVLVCSSAREADAAIDGFGPDLVLLDDRMPGADGAKTLELLRERTANPALPVIFLTAMADQRNIERLSASGAICVVRKPFDPLTLGAELHEIYRRAVNNVSPEDPD